MSGLNSAILRTLAECSVLVRLRVAIALLRSRLIESDHMPPERNQRGFCFHYAPNSMLRVRPTLSSGGSLTAMLNLVEKLQPDIPTLAASEANPGGLRLLLNRGFRLERGIKPCSVRPGNEPSLLGARQLLPGFRKPPCCTTGAHGFSCDRRTSVCSRLPHNGAQAESPHCK